MKNTQEKFDTVITKNTFYFYNREFEETYEGYVNSIKETLLVLKNHIQNTGLKKELFEDLIHRKENGLRALLALTGFSNESLKRLITFIRIVDDSELNALIYKEKWITEAEISGSENIKEWSDNKIQKKIQESEFFRKGLVNIFFEGSTIPILSNALPLFELKKLSISKLNFEIDALIDTLIRYKEKGSYSGKKENNPEVVIENILDVIITWYIKKEITTNFHQKNWYPYPDRLIPHKLFSLAFIKINFPVKEFGIKTNSLTLRPLNLYNNIIIDKAKII